LFLAYFRRFDLHYDFHLRDVPGIQQTIAVIFWRLDTVARDWKPVRGLTPEILLPGVLNQLRRSDGLSIRKRGMDSGRLRFGSLA